MKFLSFAAAFAVVGQASAAVKIMPFGASIVTECWRATLHHNLTTTGFPNIDFVGNAPTRKDCGIPYDDNHEGRPGILAAEYIDKNLVPGIVAAAKPDIVLIHLGTNDAIQNKKVPDTIAAYDKIIDQMRAGNARVRVIFSLLIPIAPDKFNNANARITDLNKAIATWAPQKSTRQSPVILVDNNTGFNVATDTYDGEHPNDSGNRKMSTVFYRELARLIPTVSRREWSRSRCTGCFAKFRG